MRNDASVLLLSLVVLLRDSITEVFFYIRKKLVARNPRIVSQALTLSEALVKNCGAKAHRAVNDEAFMKTIERVARVRFNTCAECALVSCVP